jgi:hypothetical protein
VACRKGGGAEGGGDFNNASERCTEYTVALFFWWVSAFRTHVALHSFWWLFVPTKKKKKQFGALRRALLRRLLRSEKIEIRLLMGPWPEALGKRGSKSAEWPLVSPGWAR